eukprot:4734700-Pyramimonas_sp.AAC.1
MHFVDLPVRRRGYRVSKQVPLAPPHECLEAEVGMLRSKGVQIDEMSQATEWGEAFNKHALRHLPDDDRPVFPVA